MLLDKNECLALKNVIDQKPQNIIMIAHTNPDGDAAGSLLGWSKALEKQGLNPTCIVPNRCPNFLMWLKGAENIKIFKNDKNSELENLVLDADVIFCLDFNQTSRLDALGEAIEKNTKAKKILIDHHLMPPNIYDISFSYPTSSSTCFLIYKIIEEIFTSDIIDHDIAECLYVGMLTDTGNFSFSNLEPELFSALAVLVGKGIDIPMMHRKLFNQFSEGRLRLLGYTINNKLKIIEPQRVAYMTLSESELRRFNFQMGDSEGFVNYPLSIADVNMSVMFTQNQKFIKISFRSQGDIDVNEFARKYFNGGGHKNASGGKTTWSMTKTVNYFKKCIEEYFDN
ncbi:MAG: DHH family phosphoesterase [Rikenellaceae bacterium]